MLNWLHTKTLKCLSHWRICQHKYRVSRTRETRFIDTWNRKATGESLLHKINGNNLKCIQSFVCLSFSLPDILMLFHETWNGNRHESSWSTPSTKSEHYSNKILHTRSWIFNAYDSTLLWTSSIFTEKYLQGNFMAIVPFIMYFAVQTHWKSWFMYPSARNVQNNLKDYIRKSIHLYFQPMQTTIGSP